jgi:hypothetical protein
MSTAIKVVAPVPPEVTALENACQALAQQHALERFELAVKARVQQGIQNDVDLRQTDELLHAVVLGADALEEVVKPPISAAYALHRSMTGAAGKWRKRWEDMRTSLDRLVLDYKRRLRELAERQQRELDRAAEAERQRKAAEAKAAMRNGDVAAAQQAMQESQMIVAPVIAQATPKLDNSNVRLVWEAEITDAEAVAKGIAAGVIPLSVIKEWNLTFVKDEAKRRGGLQWPGIRVWQEEKLSHRR